jgi:hypothetical protein
VTDSEEHLTALTKVKELLSNPEAWIKGAYAREHYYNEVSINPTNKKATCFCLYGAARRVWNDKEIGVASFGPERWIDLQLHRYDTAMGSSVAYWNDAPKRTHADVLAFLDAKIEFYKQQLSSTVS